MIDAEGADSRGLERVQARLLERLFLTLFLRGRSASGFEQSDAPESVPGKLAVVLGSYALVGALALGFAHRPVFALAVYLHAMSFAFLAMIIVASASEALFNKDETEVLLHRPVAPRALLRAKVVMLTRIALWVAGAFNLVGFFVGTRTSDGGWLFPLAHALSTGLQALFCTACVVIAYQVCLERFGRERLDSMMSLAQVFVSIIIVVAAQMVPRLLAGSYDSDIDSGLQSWTTQLLPPVWFAGIDDAIAGQGAATSWLLASVAVIATGAAFWFAFERLARNYEAGWQAVAEGVDAAGPGRVFLFVETMAERAPLRWWLRDPVARAGFRLTVAYLVRDRDTRLRVYPGVVPVLMVPLLSLTQGQYLGVRDNVWLAAFAGGFLGLVPMLALNLLRYSQQWQASELFRAAPMAGPAPLWQGARTAVAVVLTAPILLMSTLIICVRIDAISLVGLLLPGLISLPVYGLIPCAEAKTGPLSMPTDSAANVRRGILMMTISLFAAVLSALATWAWIANWFSTFILIEASFAAAIAAALLNNLRRKTWTSLA